MNRKITGLVSVCIGMAFCAVPVMGQETAVMESSRSEHVRMQDVQLRAEGKQKDSTVFFSPAGEKMNKFVYPDLKCYEWKNNTWIPGEHCPVTWGGVIRNFSYTIDGGKMSVTWPFGMTSGYFGGWAFDYDASLKFSEARNDNEKLTKLEYGGATWTVEYNKNNNLKSINLYAGDDLIETYDYEYLPDGENCTLYECYSYNGHDRTLLTKEVNVYGTYGSKTRVLSSELYRDSENYAKKEWEYDEDGDETILRIYSGAGNQWILDEYQVSYYSDHTGNAPVIAPAPTAYAYGGTLYIQSPRAEQVVIYSLTGAKVYEGAIPSGTTTIAARLPKGVYVVAFGDGTRQKVANN